MSSDGETCLLKRIRELLVDGDRCRVCHLLKKIGSDQLQQRQDQVSVCDVAVHVHDEISLILKTLEDAINKEREINHQEPLFKDKVLADESRMREATAEKRPRLSSMNGVVKRSRSGRLDTQTSCDSGYMGSLRRDIPGLGLLGDESSMEATFDKVEEEDSPKLSSHLSKMNSFMESEGDDLPEPAIIEDNRNETVKEILPVETTHEEESEELPEDVLKSSPGLEETVKNHKSVSSETGDPTAQVASEMTRSSALERPPPAPSASSDETLSVCVEESSDDHNTEGGVHILLAHGVEYIRMDSRLISYVVKTACKLSVFISRDNMKLQLIVCTGDKANEPVESPSDTTLVKDRKMEISVNSALSFHIESRTKFVPCIKAGPLMCPTTLHVIYPKRHALHPALTYSRSETSVLRFSVLVCGVNGDNPCHTLAQLSIALPNAPDDDSAD